MNSLQQFKTYVAEQYLLTLGLELTERLASTSNKPTWIDDDQTAWLLDPEIGIALKVVPYLDSKQDLNATIQHALRTATLLQPRLGINEDDVDKNGMWQVGVVWLVDKPNLGNDWRIGIASVRKESGFSEEIGLDAILIEDEKDLKAAFSRHGLPQLMLYARRLLNLEWSQMPSWLSANNKVSEMLEVFPDRFSGDTEAARLVSSLIADARESETSLTAGGNLSRTAPKRQTLEQIEIKHFRNIRHCHLSFPKDAGRQTQAHVIFGPNGTGKTSIFEALCLSIGGTSRTWSRFTADADVESRTRDYPTSVLSPLKGADKPEILLNGSAIQLSAGSNLDARVLDGSFLGQEDSREFLSDSSQNLGQRILKGYSTLADRLTDLAATRERAAKDEKSNWLRQHGLNASIKRRETRTQRLIEGEIQKEGWAPSQSMLDWLESASLAIPALGDDGVRVATRWRAWSKQQNKIVEQMATGALIGEANLVGAPLITWLNARNELLIATHTILSRAGSLIATLRDRLANVDKELDAWGEWLSRQSKSSSSEDSEQTNLLQQIEAARIKLLDLRNRISTIRKHATHLTQLREEFLPEWIRNSPNTCPTCGENHEKRGGIEQVVKEAEKNTLEQLAALEKEDLVLSTDLSTLEARLAALGLCPVSEQRQKDLQDLLRPFTKERTLLSYLQSIADRSDLKIRLKNAQTLPDVQNPLPINQLEDAAKRLAERSLSLDAEAERLWPLPERWNSIVSALKKECDSIVARHLPETLQKVWLEIVAAMTSARWNLASRPIFQVKDQGRLTLGIEERPDTPARYLFNQAEQHIMGLAWFIVRYLTHGRFHNAVLVLDDPAQEMDQTTFRSFARFVQALLRLHETRRLTLQLILLLHQEDRALDLARATLGRFIMLTWRKSIVADDRENFWEVRLLSEGFLPQKAIVALTSKTPEKS